MSTNDDFLRLDGVEGEAADDTPNRAMDQISLEPEGAISFVYGGGLERTETGLAQEIGGSIGGIASEFGNAAEDIFGRADPATDAGLDSGLSGFDAGDTGAVGGVSTFDDGGFNEPDAFSSGLDSGGPDSGGLDYGDTVQGDQFEDPF